VPEKPRTTPERTPPPPPPPEERHLLAVDLGLRTGLAVYGPDGRLKSYRSKHFASNSELRRGVGGIVSECPPLAWIWLEGGGDLAVIWEKQARYRGISYHQLQADEWRRGLMLPRQQRSGDIAKREADGMARRVIEWSGAPRPKGRLKHDAAEAILVGLHGALKVALLDRLPRL